MHAIRKEINSIIDEIEHLHHRLKKLEKLVEEQEKHCVESTVSVFQNEHVEQIVTALVQVQRGLLLEELEMKMGSDPRVIERHLEDLQKKGHVVRSMDKYMLSSGGRSFYESVLNVRTSAMNVG